MPTSCACACACTGVEFVFYILTPFACVHTIHTTRNLQGLGSSSAAIVSGLLAGLVLVGKELPVLGQEVLLQMAAEVEGHVDNIGPCIYGGIQLGYVQMVNVLTPQASLINHALSE